MLYILLLVAVILTAVLFTARQAMLGWPAATFWILAGGYSWTLGTDWDIYRLLGLFCLLGMVFLTSVGALSFRKQKGQETAEGDNITIEEMEEEPYMDEESGEQRTRQVKRTRTEWHPRKKGSTAVTTANSEKKGDPFDMDADKQEGNSKIKRDRTQGKNTRWGAFR